MLTPTTNQQPLCYSLTQTVPRNDKAVSWPIYLLIHYRRSTGQPIMLQMHFCVTSKPSNSLLAAAQRNDDEIQNLLGNDTSLTLKQIPIPESNHSLLCDTSQGRPRLLISRQMRHDIFNSLLCQQFACCVSSRCKGLSSFNMLAICLA